jgi:hypothetical protein
MMLFAFFMWISYPKTNNKNYEEVNITIPADSKSVLDWVYDFLPKVSRKLIFDLFC